MKHILSIVLFCAASFFVFAANPPSAVTPCTFLGRVMDATHKAFDADRSATVAAYTADGKLLSDTVAFFREETRRNYSLAVPLASSPVEGYAVQDDALTIIVTDDIGKVWRGVVVGATAGAPAAVREVDIVLGQDSNGDGIDDELYDWLESDWEESDWWSPDETFDPEKDYDGDGVSTIAEALSGTDPFNPDAVLKITAFSRSAPTRGTEVFSLSFTAVDGRAYSVEEATDLKARDWKPKAFMLSKGAEPVNYLMRPADNEPPVSCTIYLLPAQSTNSFYRIKCN